MIVRIVQRGIISPLWKWCFSLFYGKELPIKPPKQIHDSLKLRLTGFTDHDLPLLTIWQLFKNREAGARLFVPTCLTGPVVSRHIFSPLVAMPNIFPLREYRRLSTQ